MEEIIIEIPDGFIDKIKEVEDDRDLLKCQLLTFYRSMCSALLKGILISDSATNGDIIKAMFPNYRVQVSTALETVELYYDGTEAYTGSWFRFDLDWWNAPYKGE